MLDYLCMPIVMMYFYICKFIYFFYPPIDLDEEVDDKVLEMYSDL